MSTPEGKIQLAVLKYLQSRGVYCWRNNNGATYDAKIGTYRYNPSAKKGIGDIIAVLPNGLHVELEVKTKTGKQSVEQAMHERRLTQLGAVYAVVRSVGDAERALAPYL